MPRFQIQQAVQIRDVIGTNYQGCVGRIVEIQANKMGRTTLDKYVVEFSDEERQTFWDIQLRAAVLDSKLGDIPK
jgi:hypothetical protein